MSHLLTDEEYAEVMTALRAGREKIEAQRADLDTAKRNIATLRTQLELNAVEIGMLRATRDAAETTVRELEELGANFIEAMNDARKAPVSKAIAMRRLADVLGYNLNTGERRSMQQGGQDARVPGEADRG